MDERQYFVYIITNKRNTVLYTGVTNNLERRLYEHRHGLTPGFSSKYLCSKLVYYETTACIDSALNREKQIKAGSRKKKILLIESRNTQWQDLSEHWQ